MCMARQSDVIAALDPLLDPTHLEGLSPSAGFVVQGRGQVVGKGTQMPRGDGDSI